jgi:hypothetical protein
MDDHFFTAKNAKVLMGSRFTFRVSRFALDYWHVALL